MKRSYGKRRVALFLALMLAVTNVMPAMAATPSAQEVQEVQKAMATPEQHVDVNDCMIAPENEVVPAENLEISSDETSKPQKSVYDEIPVFGQKSQEEIEELDKSQKAVAETNAESLRVMKNSEIAAETFADGNATYDPQLISGNSAMVDVKFRTYEWEYSYFYTDIKVSDEGFYSGSVFVNGIEADPNQFYCGIMQADVVNPETQMLESNLSVIGSTVIEQKLTTDRIYRIHFNIYGSYPENEIQLVFNKVPTGELNLINGTAQTDVTVSGNSVLDIDWGENQAGIYKATVDLSNVSSDMKYYCQGYIDHATGGMSYDEHMTGGQKYVFYFRNREDSNRDFYIWKKTNKTASDLIRVTLEKVSLDDYPLITPGDGKTVSAPLHVQKGQDTLVCIKPMADLEYTMYTDCHNAGGDIGRNVLLSYAEGNESGTSDTQTFDYNGLYDNNLVANKELKAGYVYILFMTDNLRDGVTEDDYSLHIVPASNVDVTVPASGKTDINTDIYKMASLNFDIEEPGFYSVCLDQGEDDAYILTEPYASTFVLHKGQPAVVCFDRAGRISMKMTKETESTSKDPVHFSIEKISNELVAGETQQNIYTLQNLNDQYIFSYTPEKSGKYCIELNRKLSGNNDEDNRINESLYVYYEHMMNDGMTEGGTKYISQKWDMETSYFEEEGPRGIIHTLNQGTKYYFVISNGQDTDVQEEDGHYLELTCVNETETEGLEISAASAKVLYTEIKIDEPGIYDITIEGSQGSNYRLAINSAVYDLSSGMTMRTVMKKKGTKKIYLICKDNPVPSGNVKVSFCKGDAIVSENTNTAVVTIPGRYNKKTESYGRTDYWLKYTPAQTGTYYIISKSNLRPNRLYYNNESDETIRKQPNFLVSSLSVDSKKIYTFSLTEGNTYYINMIRYNKSANDIVFGKMDSSAITVSPSGESVSTDEISMTNVCKTELDIKSGNLYDVKVDGNGNYNLCMEYLNIYSGYTTYRNLYFSEDITQRMFWVPEDVSLVSAHLISSDTKTEEDVVNVSVAEINKDDLETKTIVPYKTYELNSNQMVNKYSMTVNDTANYTCIVGDIEKYKVRIYEGDRLFRTITEEDDNNVSLEAGKTYTIYLENLSKYPKQTFTLSFTRIIKPVLFDYDEYKAFIASGGYITYETYYRDMWYYEDEDEHAEIVSWIGGTQETAAIVLHTDRFKEQYKGKEWFPSARAYYSYRWNEVTYRDLIEDCGSRWYSDRKYGYDIQYFMDRSGNKITNFNQKINLGNAIDNNRIILGVFEPSVVLVQKIELSGTFVLKEGETSQLSAKTSSGNKYKITQDGVTYKSSNTNVVTVTETGKMTAKKAGTAYIICTSKDGNATVKKQVKVTELPKPSINYVDEVVISGSSKVDCGDTLQLKAVCKTANGKAPTLDGVYWSSSDEDIATVNKKGLVRAKSVGKVMIIAKSKDGKAVGSKKITVEEVMPTKVRLNESSILMKKGTKYKWLEVTVSPKNVTDDTIKWSSSNKKIATVSSKGVITAKAAGVVTITAKAKNGKKDTVKVKVTVANVKVKKISIGKDCKVTVGDTVKLESEIEPINATNKKLRWTSSNEDIATVSSKGVVTTKKPGTVKITCVARDGSKEKDTVKITVLEPGKVKDVEITNQSGKKAGIEWKKVDGVDGYEIYMASSRNGEYKKIKTMKGNKKMEFVAKNFKKNKTYYFKVRSYIKVGKKTIYGDFSKLEKVKIKK